MGKPIDGKSDGDGKSPVGNNEPDGNSASGDNGALVVDLDAIEPADAGSTGNGDSGGNTKRKRGRPRKDRNGSGSANGDAAPSAGSGGTGSGSQKRKKANSAALDVGTISLVCSFLSGFVAARAKEPVLKLDEAEAQQVGEAVANVGKHYDIPVSPVAQAWIALGMTVGSIYAGKIAAIKMRQGAGGNRHSEPNAPNISPFIRKATIDNEAVPAAE